jgi:uncharacterized protein YgiM (DUF1202 family)
VLAPVKKLWLGVKHRIGISSEDNSLRPVNTIVQKTIGIEKVSAENPANKKETAISADQGKEQGNTGKKKISADSFPDISVSEEGVITETQAAESTPGQFNYVSITDQVDWVNIRTGPSMQYDILRAVSSGFPLHILEQQEEWSLVEDVAKRKGWVANKLLIENNSVILKMGKGNLRSGPGYDEGIIREIEYGTVMQLEKTQGDWLKVVDKTGAEGWIHRFYIWPELVNLR